MIEYKGYKGKVEFDDDENIFHGEVINLRDVITFQGKSVKELRKAFKESIDDYFIFCKERGENPDKPYSGKFMLRIKPSLHKELSVKAKLDGKSINHWVSEVIEEKIVSLN